ncbi:hypothetical protein EMPS_04285 [Entomortierella parvispora]|uniref:Uncharacterized protein n=1 Tax=Entomortierella parvispora TaxID=205924 RepID=A0A9P3H8E4_9FUNG|nr:hypothetical protein EMPS_04285 [Entomortierella parvispora]
MKIFFALVALASVASVDIKFNVVGYPSSSSGSFGVKIAETVHKLSTSESTFPVWSGSVPGTKSQVQYSYVELSSSGTAVKTVWDLPKIPYTYLATYPSKTKAFKHKQIATIHITAPQASIDEMNQNPYNSRDYRVDFRFIKSKTIHCTVHGADGKIERGSLVQMNAWSGDRADLEYKGSTSSSCNQVVSYVNKNLGSSPESDPLMELIGFMKDSNPLILTRPPALSNTSTQVVWNSTDFCVTWHWNTWEVLSTTTGSRPPIISCTRTQPWDLTAENGNGYLLISMAPSETAPLPPSCQPTKTIMTSPPGVTPPAVHRLIIKNKEINVLFEQILKEIVSTAFKTEALKPRIEIYNKMLSLDAAWDIGITRKSPGTNNGFTFKDFNDNLYDNLYTRTKDMTTGLLPWIEQMSNIVTADLNFRIPAGLEDRDPPPPRGKGSLDNDDSDDDDSELSEDNEKGGSKVETNGAGSTKGMLSQGILVVAMLSSATLMA